MSCNNQPLTTTSNIKMLVQSGDNDFIRYNDNVIYRSFSQCQQLHVINLDQIHSKSSVYNLRHILPISSDTFFLLKLACTFIPFYYAAIFNKKQFLSL